MRLTPSKATLYIMNPHRPRASCQASIEQSPNSTGWEDPEEPVRTHMAVLLSPGTAVVGFAVQGKVLQSPITNRVYKL